MDIVECLMQTGFTRYESILYITLCREGELTGYEAAKISGIPRSNAYLALAGLVEKGGAYRIDSDAVKYTAVPARELILNIHRNIEQVLKFIEGNLPARNTANDPYITISGNVNIINKMKSVINAALERIYLSVSPDILEHILCEVTEAKERGLKVVIITDPPFAMAGAIVYHNEKKKGQIGIIADTSHVITGEIKDEGQSTCLYSKNGNLIQLIKDSLANEINLIKIKVQKNI
jgi:sugar-specific transcriptional regulator TrmB